MSEGVLFVALGDSYLEEAQKAAASVKSHNDVSIAVITDCSPSSSDFDQVITVDDTTGSFATKVEFMAESPFDKTLYLDTDTHVRGDISELFSLLDQFDIAAKHKSGYYPTGPTEYPDVPGSFPEYNTGVVAFRSTRWVDEFFESWKREYEKYVEKGGNDQPAFRKALYDSELRISTLKEEYHCRFVYPGCITGFGKIFHGRPEQANESDYQSIVEKVNKTDLPRVFVPTTSGLTVLERKTEFNVQHSDLYLLTLAEHLKASAKRTVLDVGRGLRSVKRELFNG